MRLLYIFSETSSNKHDGLFAGRSFYALICYSSWVFSWVFRSFKTCSPRSMELLPEHLSSSLTPFQIFLLSLLLVFSSHYSSFIYLFIYPNSSALFSPPSQRNCFHFWCLCSILKWRSNTCVSFSRVGDSFVIQMQSNR